MLALTPEDSEALTVLAQRNMRLQCTIQDGVVWLGNSDQHVELKPRVLLSRDA
ncbi:MAG: YaeQ family protein [Betaproteobacteria bacterium]